MISRKLAAFGAAMVALTIGAAPILTSAADHLDAPALGRTTANGQIDSPRSEPATATSTMSTSSALPTARTGPSSR